MTLPKELASNVVAALESEDKLVNVSWLTELSGIPLTLLKHTLSCRVYPKANTRVLCEGERGSHMFVVAIGELRAETTGSRRCTHFLCFVHLLMLLFFLTDSVFFVQRLLVLVMRAGNVSQSSIDLCSVLVFLALSRYREAWKAEPELRNVWLSTHFEEICDCFVILLGSDSQFKSTSLCCTSHENVSQDVWGFTKHMCFDK